MIPSRAITIGINQDAERGEKSHAVVGGMALSE
jgi:hypothetical protein